MAKRKPDVHEIYNGGRKIDSELNHIVEEAIDRKIEPVVVIPCKGSTGAPGIYKISVIGFLA